MGRPSLRRERRAEITTAFGRVLAANGYAGASMTAVAREAGVAPGLLHHYFDDKADMLTSLLADLVARFRKRTSIYEASESSLDAYVDAAVALDDTADLVAARCWVGLFAEAIREPTLFRHVRRLVDTEIETIQRRSGYALSAQDAGAVLAFIVGSLVLGAFAPRKTAGFAAPALRRLLAVLGPGKTGRSGPAERGC